MKEKVCIITLGCDKNTVDAERMAYLLEQAGYRLTDSPFECDCAVVNTCAFIDSAKKESIDRIFDMVRLKNEGKLRAIVVTGCLAQRYCDEIRREIPEADAIAAIGFNTDIANTVASALSGEKPALCGAPELLCNEGGRCVSTPKHYAYLKIAEGCDNRCTFCAIPNIRGGYRSREQSAILDEAKQLCAGGAKELIVIAQDTTAFGRDRGARELPELLRRLCETDGLMLLRIMYAYPDGVTPELAQVMASEDKIAKYIDLPLQHCNDEVLRRMGRRARRADIDRALELLRSSMPDITIRTTFIAGFPGETEKQFAELCDFARGQDFARAGCFAYSREDGTPAARLDGQHTERVKQRRAQTLNRQLSDRLAEKQAARIGETLSAFCEGEEDGRLVFRSFADAPDVDTVIYAPVGRIADGEIKKLRITGAEGTDLTAEYAE